MCLEVKKEFFISSNIQVYHGLKKDIKRIEIRQNTTEENKDVCEDGFRASRTSWTFQA